MFEEEDGRGEVGGLYEGEICNGLSRCHKNARYSRRWFSPTIDPSKLKNNHWLEHTVWQIAVFDCYDQSWLFGMML